MRRKQKNLNDEKNESRNNNKKNVLVLESEDLGEWQRENNKEGEWKTFLFFPPLYSPPIRPRIFFFSTPCDSHTSTQQKGFLIWNDVESYKQRVFTNKNQTHKNKNFPWRGEKIKRKNWMLFSFSFPFFFLCVVVLYVYCKESISWEFKQTTIQFSSC